MKADIKIWILTGDKQETAINIGNALNQTSNVKLLNGVGIFQKIDLRSFRTWQRIIYLQYRWDYLVTHGQCPFYISCSYNPFMEKADFLYFRILTDRYKVPKIKWIIYPQQTLQKPRNKPKPEKKKTILLLTIFSQSIQFNILSGFSCQSLTRFV